MLSERSIMVQRGVRRQRGSPPKEKLDCPLTPEPTINKRFVSVVDYYHLRLRITGSQSSNLERSRDRRPQGHRTVRDGFRRYGRLGLRDFLAKQIKAGRKLRDA